VAQGLGLEFKPQYRKKQKQKTRGKLLAILELGTQGLRVEKKEAMRVGKLD
jgi:hypothetical protein